MGDGWMGDRLGIHGAVDIFPQMKQADLFLKMSLHFFTFAHSMLVSGQGQPLNVHLSTVQRYITLQYNTVHMF